MSEIGLKSATMTQTYVPRPKLSSPYVTRPKLSSPILQPIGNYMGTIPTYSSRACRKTPTTDLGIYPDLRRIYLIDILIGDIAVPHRRKLLCGVASTMRDFICTVRTGFRYLHLKSVQVYWVYKIINSTSCIRKTVEL